MDEKLSRKRHLAKTITWRIIGTIDTVLIGWVVTGDPWIGVQVGGVEMVTKMAQPRNKMGHPGLSVGGSRRFREVFSEGFWLKVIWF